MTKIEKAMAQLADVEKVIIGNACPHHFGMADRRGYCNSLTKKYFISSCEECWNEEYEEDNQEEGQE